MAAVIRIDSLWLAVEPVDMRAGADRLLASLEEVKLWRPAGGTNALELLLVLWCPGASAVIAALGVVNEGVVLGLAAVMPEG